VGENRSLDPQATEPKSDQKTESYDLPGILRGKMPEASTVALIGAPGTGTTVFCLHFIANSLMSGRKVIVVSFDYLPSVLTRYFTFFGFDARPHIADGSLMMIDGYEILCSKMGITHTYEIENLRPISSDEVISVFDEEAFKKYEPREREHFSCVADSFTAMSPFLDVRSAYNIVAEICDRIRKGGHIALLVGREGVLESNIVQPMTRYVDGVIRLRMAWLKKGMTREIIVQKLPFGATSHPSVEFEISGKGIELKYDDSKETIGMTHDLFLKVKAKMEREGSLQPREERIKTGMPDLDLMIDGGLPKGTFVCVEGDIGTGTSTLCAQYTWSQLQAGENVNYNCVDEPPDLVIKRFNRFGWDISPYIEKRKLALTDARHFFAGIPRIPDRGLKKVSDRRIALDDFMRRQSEAVMSTFGTTAVSVVIDSFTAMAPYLDLKSSYVLARMIADSAKRTNHVILAVVRSGIVEANLLYACLGAADGLMEMENIWVRRNLVRRIKVHKMAFTSIPSYPIKYSITDQGIQLISSEKE
jgi:KaiC/GvpD/RAD55 family RecA-like ATPase